MIVLKIKYNQVENIYMLHKVIKQMKKAGKNVGEPSGSERKSSKKNPLDGSVGFHAKKNSLAGAARQRSMGNRNTKPPR